MFMIKFNLLYNWRILYVYMYVVTYHYYYHYWYVNNS